MLFTFGSCFILFSCHLTENLNLLNNPFFFCLFFQSDAGWEEYHDYIFPDEEAAQPNLKLLAMAKKWKQKVDNEEES